MSAMRPENTGIALATMYATRVTPNVELSQVVQWTALLEVRWLNILHDDRESVGRLRPVGG